jgi:outer membrane protein
MKHSAFFVLLLSVCCGTAPGQTDVPASDSLTVEEAISRVLASYPAVQQASAGVEAATARLGQANSGYYPTIAAEVLYARIGPVPEIAFPGLGVFKFYPENNYDAHIGVRQMVYDFGRRSAAVDLGESGIRTASDNVTAVRTGLAYQTIQVFYAILFLEQSLDVQNQELAALREHLDITQKRVEGGSGTEFEVTTTRVRLAAAETRRIDIETTLRNQQLALGRLLDQPPGAPLALKGSFASGVVPLAGDSLTALAFEHRTELALTRDALRAADLQHHLATLEDLPSVSMNLSYGLKNGYIPNLDVLRGNWVAGLMVEVPIFNGFRTRSREEETLALSKSARAGQSVLERSITLEVQQALEGVRSARDKMQTANVQVEQSLDAVRNARIRYEAGTATNLDLLDAETSLSQAQLARVSSAYQYTLSRYSLDRATGMLPIGTSNSSGIR